MTEKAPSLNVGTLIGVENDENVVEPTTSHNNHDLEAGEDEEDTTSHDDNDDPEADIPAPVFTCYVCRSNAHQ